MNRYDGAPELVRRLVSTAAEMPSVPVRFVGDDGQIDLCSVGELFSEAEVLSGRLAEVGVVAGDIVAIRGPGSSRGTSTAILACTLGGFVAAPLVSLLGDSDIDVILDSSRAKVLLCESAIRGRDLSAHLLNVRAERPNVVTAGIADLDRDEFRLPDQHVEHQVDWSGIDDQTLAFVQFSSGTTGVPKGIMHSYRSVFAEVHDFADQLDVLDAGHLLQPFPLGHIGGLAGLYIAGCLGRETTMLSSWNASIAIDIIDQYKITSTGSTPYFALTLFDERAARGTGLESLTTMESGGGYVGRDLVYRAAEFGIALSRGYGSSEHPTATTHHSWDSVDVRAESDGLPTNGTRIRIVDPELRDVPQGTQGEVLLDGPEQLLGYLSGDRSAFDGKWFRTGDVGKLTSEGRLVITGRLKEIIIRGGENISMGEVEEHLIAHPLIVEAAVAGVYDAKLGERAHAFLVLIPGTKAVDLQEVRRWFGERQVAKFKTPEFVTLVESLPRNTLGKIQKNVLVDRYSSGSGGDQVS